MLSFFIGSDILFTPPALFITFLSFSFIIFVLSKRSKTKFSNAKLPPGPRKLPIIGNMHQLLSSLPHHRLKDLSRKYGPIMHLQLGQVPSVVVSSSEMAKEVYKTHDIALADRPSSLAARILTYNHKDFTFGPYGDQWKQLRKICVLELLSAKRTQSFRSIREEEVSSLVRSIAARSNEGLPVNLSLMLISLTSRIVVSTVLGDSCKHKEAFVPFIRELMQAFGGFGIADFFPSVGILHAISGDRGKVMKLHQTMDKLLETIIDERRGIRRGREGRGSMDEEKNLLDVLLSLQEYGESETPLSTETIKAVMFDIFAAGIDTSASLMEWAMSAIIRDPSIKAKVQAEVRQVFHGKNVNIDETSSRKLNYFNAVIKETLRLFPPAPLVGQREARESVKINGYDVPAKTKIIINGWAIGRDPRFWNDAERFDPERFIDNPIDYRGTQFEYIPFGGGRRLCPGISYGLSTTELALANLLYHFDWKLPDGLKAENLDMSEEFGITVARKNQLNLIATPYHPPLPLESRN